MKKLLCTAILLGLIVPGFALALEHTIIIWDDVADNFYMGGDGIISFVHYNFGEQWVQDGPHQIDPVGINVADLEVHSTATGWWAALSTMPDGYTWAPGQNAFVNIPYPETTYVFHIVPD